MRPLASLVHAVPYSVSTSQHSEYNKYVTASGDVRKETHMTGAYLQITLKIASANRPAAARVYVDYREPFLKTIPGAQSKELLLREEDVQVLHGFDTVEHAAAYLKSSLFQNDVVAALAPNLSAEPEIRIYACG